MVSLISLILGLMVVGLSFPSFPTTTHLSLHYQPGLTSGYKRFPLPPCSCLAGGSGLGRRVEEVVGGVVGSFFPTLSTYSLTYYLVTSRIDLKSFLLESDAPWLTVGMMELVVCL